jgi:hypothetical protein
MAMDEKRRSYSGACIGIPFTDVLRRECYGNPDGFCYASWREGPIALRRRLDRGECAPVDRPKSV